jgi:TonB-linked SusC/RagA family outer membrane protein
MKLKLHVALTMTLLLFTQVLFAQSRTVTGTVTASDTKESLPGVSVVIEGTTKGTVTDLDGKYAIEVEDNLAVLVFSYIGMNTQRKEVGTQSTISVELQSGVDLDEFVVTALGISREKKSLGYATQEVAGDEVNTIKRDNFINNLSGKAAGVQIKTNTNMGGSTNVLIRGNTSLTGNNQALFVIDGVPMDNSNTTTSRVAQGSSGYDYGSGISDINPEDIKSMNVLKGAAATALYGERAANGAIIITTKKGSEKGATGRTGLGVNFSSTAQVGVADKTTFPSYQNGYGAGYGPFYSDTEYPGLEYYDYNGDGVEEYVVPFGEDGSMGQAFDPNLLVAQWNALDPASPQYNTLTPWVAAENQAIEFFNPAWTFTNSVSVNGANDKGSFRLSYQNIDQKGLMPNSSLKRNNVSLNASFNVTDDVTVSGSANYAATNTIGRNSVGYSNNLMSMFRQWWQVNVDLQQQEDIFNSTDRNVTWNPASASTPTTPLYWDNPYWQRYKNFQSDSRDRLFGNLIIDWKLTDYLTWMVRASVDTYTTLQEERREQGSTASRFGISRLEVTSGYSKYTKSFLESIFFSTLTFNNDLNENLNLNAFIGTEIRRDHIQTQFSSTNGGLIVPGVFALSNTVNPSLAPEETDDWYGVTGLFAGATLGYKRFLYLDATVRNDWSSTLPENDNSYIYPAVSASWIFSEQLDIDAISFAKLSANYAEVGSSPQPYLTIPTYTIGTSFGSSALTSLPNTNNNPNLGPERTKSIEAGLEMFFLQRRIGVNFTWYQAKSQDQIFNASVSRATGFSSTVLNAGDIQNTGIELVLTGAPIVKDKFRWDIDVNFAQNKNEVTALQEGIDNLQLGSLQGGITINATVGQPYGTIQGTTYNYLEGHEGDDAYRIVGSNGYYERSSTSDNILGDVTPDFNMGINNRFKYGNWNFSFLIDWQQGGQLFSLDQWYGKGTGLYETTVFNNDLGNPVRSPIVTNDEGVIQPNSGGLVLEGVLADGTPNDIRVAGDNYLVFGWARNPNAGFIYDATYVKLREIVLTYSLPASMLGDGFFRGVSFSFIANNVWIIAKDLPDADPEAGITAGNIQGWQSGVMPTARTFGLTVNLQF